MRDIKMLEGFKYNNTVINSIFYLIIGLVLFANLLSGEYHDVIWIGLLLLNMFMADSAMGMYQIRTEEVKKLYGKK